MGKRLSSLFALALCALCAACGGASYGSSYGPNDATMRESTGGSMSGDAAMAAPAPMPPPMEPKADIAEESMVMGGLEGGSDMRLAQAERAPARKEAPGAAPPAPPPPPPPGGGKAKPATGGGEAVSIQAPMLIYTAELTMAVFEVAPSLAKVEALARDLGGFLAKRNDTSITIRVPVDRFDEAVKRVEDSGDVLHRNVAVQDVTEEYRDLDIQLKNARAIRDRLAELLAKATKVEESLLIERELGRVAREVDRLEGRMKFLRDRASFSTITVMFQPRPTENVGVGPFHLPVPWLSEMGLGRLLQL